MRQIKEKPQKRREMQTSMQQLRNSGAISTKMMFYCKKTPLREKFTTKKLRTQGRSIHFSEMTTYKAGDKVAFCSKIMDF